ncbi:ChbG/HpnK family deacetylase [Ruania alkalisoli]|uniref:ChbG/HpnK family deacetylase n=1 Tax=Ruania alkalisoli TaxID=2779775 RepID=A0A7M1SPM5_9MICO|nr:ChbG/HpnK family deacetylase [Ruania alkalisoli]QOR69401.1 ChbG/HpnK family deacetylase [Ruania alkalisoli]
MQRRLVITADDLGVDPETNATIVELLRERAISATTLIPVASAAEDAVRRLKAAGLTQPRLHITFSSARGLPAWGPLAPGVGTLTDARGKFALDPAHAERRASMPDVTRELLAQLDWMRRSGMRPAGLDSHSGTLYGLYGRSMAGDAVDFCAANGLDFRMPRRLSRTLGLAVRGLRRAHRSAVQRADALRVRLPEVLVSSWLPGPMVLSYAQLRTEVLAQLRRLPAGTSELITHPSPPSAAHWLPVAEARKRLWELRLLRDDVFHRALRRAGIEVVPAW